MNRSRRPERLAVSIVVNAPGVQVRRARALAAHLPARVAARVVKGGRREALRAAVSGGEVLYVIDPGSVGFPAALAGRLAQKVVVVEVGDPQAPLYRAQRRSRAACATGAVIDALVVRHADALVLRGRGLAETLGVRVPWIELPDGVDVGRFHPGLGEQARARLGVPDDALLVGVVGSLAGRREGVGYGWDVVEALGLLAEEPVWALVVGGGPGLEPLRRRASALGVADRFLTTGNVPHDEVAAYVAAADVCVSTQTNDPVGQGRTTAKLPEYLACDRYVVATAVGAAADVLPDEMLLPYQGAYDPGYSVRLAARLAELVPRRFELRRGAGTRAIAVERYSYPALARRLSVFLEDLAR